MFQKKFIQKLTHNSHYDEINDAFTEPNIYEIQPIPIITVKMTNLNNQKNTKRKTNLIIMRYGTQQ